MRGFTLTALLIFSCAAGADQVLTPIPEIISVQQQVRAELKSGKGIYRAMSEAERNEILLRQDRLLGLIENHTSLKELNPDRQTQVINDLEWIQARLTQAEDDRQVCTQSKPVGSNLTRRTCKSVRQMRLEREQAQQMLDSRQYCVSDVACGRKN